MRHVLLNLLVMGLAITAARTARAVDDRSPISWVPCMSTAAAGADPVPPAKPSPHATGVSSGCSSNAPVSRRCGTSRGVVKSQEPVTVATWPSRRSSGRIAGLVIDGGVRDVAEQGALATSP